MLSKNTVMAAAIVIIREAMKNNDVHGPKGDIIRCILNGNIYGMFSDTTMLGSNAEQLHEWYGTEIFELHAGVKYDATRSIFEGFKSNMSGSEYVNLSDWGSIDDLLQDDGLYELSHEDYEDEYGYTKENELATAPHGLLVNQVLQVINWEELWQDTDFTVDTEDVVFMMNNNLVTDRNEYSRVLNINAALDHYGFPPMRKFISPLFSGPIIGPDASNTPVQAYLSKVFLDFVQSYLGSISVNPLELRSLGYIRL